MAKRSTKKKRPATASKSLRSRAKKHGIKVTKMVGGKRKNKTSKELLKQVKAAEGRVRKGKTSRPRVSVSSYKVKGHTRKARRFGK